MIEQGHWGLARLVAYRVLRPATARALGLTALSVLPSIITEENVACWRAHWDFDNRMRALNNARVRRSGNSDW